MAKKAVQKSLKLAAVLDLNEASELRSTLMTMRGSSITIDASGVERVGAQCVQVLMAGARAWDNDKQSFAFEKVSDVFLKTIQLIGINIDHLLTKGIRQ